MIKSLDCFPDGYGTYISTLVTSEIKSFELTCFDSKRYL